MEEATTEVLDKRLSIEEAAKKAGVCRRTIENWIDKGILPCKKTKSGRVRIEQEDLKEALALE